jgi:hypothetical protein
MRPFCRLPPDQASVELPGADAEAAELRACYAPALHWADAFWASCLARHAPCRTNACNCMHQTVHRGLFSGCRHACCISVLRVIALAGKRQTTSAATANA